MLEIKSLSKTFFPGTADEKKAIDNLSLKVNDGDFITVLGSNGAGKSTLFNLIAGSLLPDEGSIIMDGQDITYIPEYKKARYIGRLFQNPSTGTAPNMSIKENLALAYLRSDSSKSLFSRISKQDEAFFYEKLKLLNMGLEERMDQKVGTLSGGQRQALALLMATITPPKILLLDEHTAALDPGQAELINALTEKTVRDNHITCLMITHQLNQALKTGNRSILMSEGRIILDISGEEKEKTTAEQLLSEFKSKELDDDRILLS